MSGAFLCARARKVISRQKPGVPCAALSGKESHEAIEKIKTLQQKFTDVFTGVKRCVKIQN